MKIKQLYSILAVCACILGLGNIAHAFDFSQTILLERYTIIDDSSLQYDQGYLLANGKFKVIDSIQIGYFGLKEETFEPISGRPIMIEGTYDAYKSSRLIPRWTHSADGFYIDLEGPYVIVSVAGGADPNPAITIHTQPTNQVVLSGDFTYFSIDASPADYLSYQWFFNNKPIPDETASYLIINEATSKQAGTYSVQMNTGGKKVMSKKVCLKVILPVQIATTPKSQSIKTGHGVVFRVTAKGPGPFTYQWYYNGNPIPNATKSFYSLSKVTDANAGQYSVVVSNKLSSATSSAVLTVTP